MIHSVQVLWMTEEVAPFVLEIAPEFNVDLARTSALVHDDSEIVGGDILGILKSAMNEAERKRYEADEARAIEQLSSRWPRFVNGFVYRNLLYLALRKNTAEAQLVSYLDKQASLTESWHEIFAGNRVFYNPSSGKKPPVRGSEILKLRARYTLISRLFECSHPFLAEFQAPDPEKALAIGKPHTSESIYQQTGFALYDCWKNIILTRGREEGLGWLIEQKEFVV